MQIQSCALSSIMHSTYGNSLKFVKWIEVHTKLTLLSHCKPQVGGPMVQYQTGLSSRTLTGISWSSFLSDYHLRCSGVVRGYWDQTVMPASRTFYTCNGRAIFLVILITSPLQSSESQCSVTSQMQGLWGTVTNWLACRLLNLQLTS